MNFLAVTLVLALAVFTESQAFSIRDVSASMLPPLNKELQKYARSFSKILEEYSRVVRRSKLGQELIYQINGVISNLSRQLHLLQKEAPAEVTQAYERVDRVLWDVVEKLFTALYEMRRQARPATEGLYQSLQPYASLVLEWAGPSAEMLQATIFARAEDLSPKLKNELKRHLEELRPQLDPYAKVFRSGVQEIQGSLEPCVVRAQQMFRQGMEQAKPYLAPFLEVLEQNE